MKKILIVGGSRGIGRACVEHFCASGDRVLFLYRQNHAAAAEVSAKTGAEGIACDVGNPEEARAAVLEGIRRLNGLDSLIYNTGISSIKLFGDLTQGEWDRLMAVNLSGAYACVQAALPTLLRQQAGQIVLIGSIWGKIGASCEVAYSATKAGLRGMTMALAKELGPSGIRVNCVEPGVIATDMNGELSQETLEELKEQTPLWRIGQPADVANAVAFLTSDAASFITGQILGVDGGFPA